MFHSHIFFYADGIQKQSCNKFVTFLSPATFLLYYFLTLEIKVGQVYPQALKSQTDLSPFKMQLMEKVMNILTKKQPYFNTVSPSSSIGDALSRMSCENTDYLIVMDNEQFLGVLTEHDITSKVMFNSRPLHQTCVKEMMNTRLPVANSDATIEGCIRLMRQFNVRYVPVFENYHFCGVVSSDDILQEAVYHRNEIFDEKTEHVL